MTPWPRYQMRLLTIAVPFGVACLAPAFDVCGDKHYADAKACGAQTNDGEGYPLHVYY